MNLTMVTAMRSFQGRFANILAFQPRTGEEMEVEREKWHIKKTMLLPYQCENMIDYFVKNESDQKQLKFKLTDWDNS